MLPSLRRSRRYLQLDAQLGEVAGLVVPDRHTHTHTHRPSTVTLAHARQGLIITSQSLVTDHVHTYSTSLHDPLVSRNHTSESAVSSSPNPPTTITSGWCPVMISPITQVACWDLTGGFPLVLILLQCCEIMHGGIHNTYIYMYNVHAYLLEVTKQLTCMKCKCTFVVESTSYMSVA